MTLRQAQFQSIDHVPEAYREFASESDSGAVVNIPEGRDVMLVDKTLWESRHKAIGERDTEVRRLKTDKKTAMEQLEALQAERDEFAARLEALGDDADIDQKVKAASEQKIQQIAKQKDAEVAAAIAKAEEAMKRAQELASEHERDLVMSDVYGALAEAKAHSPDIVAPAVARTARVQRDDEGRIVRGSDGKPVIEVVVDGVVQVTGDGSPMKLRDWVKTAFVSANPMQFEGAFTAGGGARGGGSRGGPGANTNPLKSGDIERAMRVAKTDPAQYKRWQEELRQQA